MGIINLAIMVVSSSALLKKIGELSAFTSRTSELSKGNVHNRRLDDPSD